MTIEERFLVQTINSENLYTFVKINEDKGKTFKLVELTKEDLNNYEIDSEEDAINSQLPRIKRKT